MPYRSVNIPADARHADRMLVRVSDAAICEWLRERGHLRARGYPDRPPDVDTPTLRAWVPRRGEAGLPYFRRDTPEAVEAGPATFIPIYTASWHCPNGLTAKVLVTGQTDGAFLCRCLIVEPSGACPVDRAHLLGPEVLPEAVWAEVETLVTFLNEAPMDWGPDDPLVTTYEDFVALDEELVVAKAEARAAGLLAPVWVN